jgi:3-hydroxybutyrate dehydrogenase
MNVAMTASAHVSNKPLNGKVSLIIGSTSGIRLGIARAAAAGSSIILNGFGKSEEIAAAQEAIKSDFSVSALYSSADMSKPKAIEDMMAMTLDSYGRLDVLVNNADIQYVAPLARISGRKVGPNSCHQSIVGLPHEPRLACLAKCDKHDPICQDNYSILVTTMTTHQ